MFKVLNKFLYFLRLFSYFFRCWQDAQFNWAEPTDSVNAVNSMPIGLRDWTIDKNAEDKSLAGLHYIAITIWFIMYFSAFGVINNGDYTNTPISIKWRCVMNEKLWRTAPFQLVLGHKKRATRYLFITLKRCWLILKILSLLVSAVNLQ